MIDDAYPLVLGSGSPRRREILEALRIPFVVVTAEIDEAPLPAEAPAPYLDRIVRAKLAAVAAAPGARGAPALLVADTAVLVGERIFGKPRDEADAARMIRELSGRSHEVHTRFALGDGRGGDASTPAHAETVVSTVVFRALTDDEIAGYARSGEGLDKAGAYAVQGLGAFAVARIEGSYASVVGLPACEVVVALRSLGLLGPYPR